MTLLRNSQVSGCFNLLLTRIGTLPSIALRLQSPACADETAATIRRISRVTAPIPNGAEDSRCIPSVFDWGRMEVAMPGAAEPISGGGEARVSFREAVLEASP